MPDKVYLQAARLAELMNRDVAHVLKDTIENALAPLGTASLAVKPYADLSDAEVLAATELRMSEVQGQRLNKLLDRQQAGTLSEVERSELAALMQVYHEGLVRKAQALHEAVRRGLRAPLSS